MPRTIVADTSVLINFCHLDRLELLGALGASIVVPVEVEAEILEPLEVERLGTALERGSLHRVEAVDHGHLLRVEELCRRRLDRGEASCLALAEARGWMVACDERRLFLRCAAEVLGPGRVIDTAGLLLSAIRAGVLDVSTADRAKELLAERRYRMTFASFADLLP